ncbi:hypothetical protein T492DRAFT_883159 [Pavlovales sp. CCMP2436]|nr:hypothetical protein T492DRAFT_883159 [Pavlovales sp. CCMP2436]
MPGAGPIPRATANELEGWIETLYAGKCIPEAAVLQLCKKRALRECALGKEERNNMRG